MFIAFAWIIGFLFLVSGAAIATIVVGYCSSLWADSHVSQEFNDYPASLYAGPLHIPKGISKGDDGYWRDSVGKRTNAPQINYAGKYYVALHGCGAGCRYYSITDLSSGIELDALQGFSSAEPPARTKEGYLYTTALYTKKDSYLIRAKYMIETPLKIICRERFFLLKEQVVMEVGKSIIVHCQGDEGS